MKEATTYGRTVTCATRLPQKPSEFSDVVSHTREAKRTCRAKKQYRWTAHPRLPFKATAHCHGTDDDAKECNDEFLDPYAKQTAIRPNRQQAQEQNQPAASPQI